jgi:hypothetical protein
MMCAALDRMCVAVSELLAGTKDRDVVESMVEILKNEQPVEEVMDEGTTIATVERCKLDIAVLKRVIGDLTKEKRR